MRVWLILGLAVAAGAQTAPPKGPAGFTLVKGAPYSAVREYDRDQKRPEGTYKLHEQTRIWRDSAGRVRTEMTNDKNHKVLNYMTDPTGKVQYTWVDGSKEGTIRHLGEPIPVREQTHPLAEGEIRSVNVNSADGQRVKGTASLLPPKTIDGMETVGSHVVQFGDADRKQVIGTTDSWYQPELHIALLTDSTDERYGHRHFQIKSVKREEPKASLFELPKGVKFKEAETPDTEEFQ